MAGVRLARRPSVYPGASIVVCGLAGALAPGLAAGTVLVPEWVGRPDGGMVRCDRALVRALADAARALGLDVETGPLLTAPALVTGRARGAWARRGFVAADMETGVLIDGSLRVATVRVALDSAEREIAREWVRPGAALIQPRLWRETLWLCRAGPRYAWRAARVLRMGIEGDLARADGHSAARCAGRRVLGVGKG